MSEGLPRPVWETLPAERQHGLVLTLGQMAMRQIRSASTAASDDHRGDQPMMTERGSHAAALWRAVREDLSPAS